MPRERHPYAPVLRRPLAPICAQGLLGNVCANVRPCGALAQGGPSPFGQSWPIESCFGRRFGSKPLRAKGRLRVGTSTIPNSQSLCGGILPVTRPAHGARAQRRGRRALQPQDPNPASPATTGAPSRNDRAHPQSLSACRRQDRGPARLRDRTTVSSDASPATRSRRFRSHLRTRPRLPTAGPD